jgi:hypothetical protein
MTRILLLVLVVLAVPVSARGQGASPEESLKAVHQLLERAVASGNISMVSNLVHPQALGFFRESQRLVELRSGYGPAEVLPSVLTDLSGFTSTTYETTYRVVGDVGVVAMTTTAQAKDSRVRDRYLRSTYVYMRAQGTWRLLSWHTSDTPLAR